MIKLQTITKTLLLLIVLAFVGLPVQVRAAPATLPTIPAQAPAADACNPANDPTYTALFKADPGSYDVYARLGRANQQATAKVSFAPFDGGNCTIIGKTDVNGDSWQKVGTWKSSGQDGFGTFSLASPAIDGLPDANRPTVMLVSQTNPVCQPTNECFVKIGDRTGQVQAPGSLLNEDTLHIVNVVDPAKDKIDRVDYYVDDKAVYSKPVLEPFNLRYVGAGQHALNTVISYKSKQRVIITDSIDRGFTDELSYIFFSFVYGQRTGLEFVTAVFVFGIIAYSLLSVIRAIYKKHLWKVHHFAKDPLAPADATPAQPAPSLPLTPAQPHFIKPDSALKATIKYAIRLFVLMGIALTLVLVLNNFVVQLYSVDGPSMNTTLYTGQKLAVNRLPQTWAHITGQKYIPGRGDVIVFKKEVDVLFAPTDSLSGPDYVVKRVVGLPGERVTLKTGVITVYNSAHPEGINPDAGHSWSSNVQFSHSDNIDVTLEPGQIFVCGDNRPDSIDSRYYGAVKSDNIIGQAVLRVTPKPERL